MFRTIRRCRTPLPVTATAVLLCLLLAACGSSDAPTTAAAPDPENPATACTLPDEAARATAVTRQPAEAPLADLSHFAARRAPRAADAVLNGGGCEDNTAFRYGAGHGDITGVALDQGMLGYADFAQTSRGLLERQLARAIVIASDCGGRQGRVALVSVDNALAFHAVRQAAVERLAERGLGAFYGFDNLMLTATHTHASAGGQAHHDLYNITTLGHDTVGFDAFVDGVVDAVAAAHVAAEAAPAGPIRLAQGELLDATVNRSAVAYALNPEAERAAFVDSRGDEVRTNRMMTLLRLSRDDGTDVAMLNWFAIHGTSLAQTNRLLAGDNKGFAARRFEQEMAARSPGFVAAFLQADEGDNSPNIFITDLSEAEIRDLEGDAFMRRGGGDNDLDSTAISGLKQYASARRLWRAADEPLRGEVAVRHAFIDMTQVAVRPRREYPPELLPPGTEVVNTCNPALGASFASGAEDGRGPFSEGQACPTPLETLTGIADSLNSIIGNALAGIIPSQIVTPIGCNNPVLGVLGFACQEEKPVLIPMTVSPFILGQGLGHSVVPIQLITVGNLAIIALPWEVTTMSGRRIRDSVLDRLEGAGIDYAVISGLSNAYVHYLTTREEYASQQYEGASTLYGPWTQEAVEQEAVRLASALRANEAVDSPFAVADFRTRRSVFLRPQNTPDDPAGRRFGEVLEQPAERVQLAAEPPLLRAVFVAGHPRRDIRRGSSYLFVERQRADGDWQVVATDHDASTRVGYVPAASNQPLQAVMEWRPRLDTAAGTYRLRHVGRGPDGPYEGISRTITVLPCGA